MILRTQNIIRITRVAAISWLLLLGACSDSADEAGLMRPDTPGTGGVDDETSSCTLGLYVRMGDSAGKQDSRAATPPDNEHYLPGTGYENYIYFGGETPDLRVYLFNLDDKLIAEIAEPNLNAMAAPGSGVVTYSITFRVDELIPDCYEQPSFKVVMLANWRTYPAASSLEAGVTTIADLVESAEGIADYSPAPAVLGLNDRLPFFGVAQYNNVKFLPDETTFADESLWLLRAYAKIEVWDNAETVTPISAVRLVGHNTHAYKAPLGVTHQDQYVKFDYDNDADFVTTPSLPAANPSVWETSEPLTFEKRAADGHFVTYVPEYRNIGREEADRCHLEVVYADGNVFKVPFRYGAGAPSGVAAGDPYDVLRNYWYKFVCKRNASELICVADIQPYAEVKLDPFFGFDRDEEGNIIIKRNEDGSNEIFENGQIVTKDPDGDIIIKKFSDGTLLCKEVVYKDYIHDNSEVDYEYIYEKDGMGGNMIIIRELSGGGVAHGEDDADHDHDMNDRPLFVLDHDGAFQRVFYDGSGNRSLSPYDTDGAQIVQVNGYQFRDVDEMSRYIGTYIVLKDGNEELRYYKDGSVVPWDTGIDGIETTARKSSSEGTHRCRQQILAAMLKLNQALLLHRR